MTRLTTLLQRFAAPAADIGQPMFWTHLDQLFEGILPHDMRWIIVYSASAAPQVMGHSVPTRCQGVVNHDLIRRTYDAGYFRFDPFYRHWRDHRQGGVHRLSDMPIQKKRMRPIWQVLSP